MKAASEASLALTVLSVYHTSVRDDYDPRFQKEEMVMIWLQLAQKLKQKWQLQLRWKKDAPGNVATTTCHFICWHDLRLANLTVNFGSKIVEIPNTWSYQVLLKNNMIPSVTFRMVKIPPMKLYGGTTNMIFYS